MYNNIEVLTQLRTEFEQGQKMLTDLEARQVELRSTLLRISGAIQVLAEELSMSQPGTLNEVGSKSTSQPLGMS